jgi:hypothetical protein
MRKGITHILAYLEKIMSTQQRSMMKTMTAYTRGVSPAAMVVGALLLISSMAAGARTWLRAPVAGTTVTTTKAPAPAHLPAAPPPGAAAVKDRLEALIVKLRRTGFEPTEVTRSQGSFLLAFDNLTGEDEIDLRLEQETGNKLHEVRMPRGNVRWRQALDLHPGRYVLSVADHPEWACHITITAR